MPDFVDLAAKLSPAVVNISTDEPDEPAEGVEPPQIPEGIEPPSGHEGAPPHSHSPFEEFGGPQHSKALGSGFIITKDGYILTNDHVVENPGKVTVTTQDGRNYMAKIVGHDDKSDIALLKIDAEARSAGRAAGQLRRLQSRRMGDGDRQSVRLRSFGDGRNRQRQRPLHSGQLRRFHPDRRVDQSGQLGRTADRSARRRWSALTRRSTRVPAPTWESASRSRSIWSKKNSRSCAIAGKVVRGWLGVYIQKITPELAESLGLADPRGALVAEVLEGRPREDARASSAAT